MDHLDYAATEAAGLVDWRRLAQRLHARFVGAGLSASAAFVGALSDLDDDAPPHLEARIAGGVVDLVVGTQEGGLWVTARDVELARAVSGLAAEHGLTAQPTAVAQLELGLDTADQGSIASFWSALLTGSPDHVVHDTVIDPEGQVPNVWFQATDPHEPPRQRWHGDLWLPPEVAASRIAAAVEAGGRVVSTDGAPAFTVLADADDNLVCVCTADSR